MGHGGEFEAKLLMLEHVFERLGCMRVEFKTDARNERSRAALETLPAKFEGIFRRHMIIEDVGVRDSAFYSITDEDWPTVRINLRTAPRCGTRMTGSAELAERVCWAVWRGV